MPGPPAGAGAAAAAGLTSEEYKAQLRAQGRKVLEHFSQRHKTGATGAGAARAAAASASATPPPAVELTTFRVVTQPAPSVSSATGTVPPPPAPVQLRALASTSLGALPPGSACLVPPRAPPSCTAATASVGGSLGSTSTGFSLASSAAPGAGLLGGASSLSGAAEAELEGRLAGSGGSGSGDQAMIDMLLAQVSSLMKDKASLAAENAALRQQAEQLTELVGWLSLERNSTDGADAQGSAYDMSMGYDNAYVLPPPGDSAELYESYLYDDAPQHVPSQAEVDAAAGAAAAGEEGRQGEGTVDGADAAASSVADGADAADAVQAEREGGQQQAAGKQSEGPAPVECGPLGPLGPLGPGS
ncbi:hypothetical protein HYH03_000880 [Edaphochlamys debaryana]|uniref:Uncharacterized protein n=1 Tax=Edaphochlamys debaryana TaxID=47281 RepID=A0A835YEF1_9CHLO|nr:hypothetical protein HYH03_000880 [Edaphochlamys debaryana]|eukprot:KAG2501061.1 hypothetical protein HYH03_000880 [Edaphochlamys debaryana]